MMTATLPAWSAEVLQERTRETGVKSWKIHHRGVALELAQITPDQARAFFLGRGFDRVDAERYAASCVFTAILRNEGVSPSISYRLADWRAVTADGQRRKLKLKEEWMKDWEVRGLPQARRIAFEWSQLPSEQNFELGDWNQGMITLAAPRGAAFDLEFTWSVKGNSERTTMKGVICAKDD